jgi:hypothetical protein
MIYYNYRLLCLDVKILGLSLDTRSTTVLLRAKHFAMQYQVRYHIDPPFIVEGKRHDRTLLTIPETFYCNEINNQIRRGS